MKELREIIGYTKKGTPVYGIVGGATGDPQLVHQDKRLTQISMGFDQGDFVAEVLFPTVTVSNQSDKYFVFTRRENMQVHQDIRTPGARANELPPMTQAEDSYFAQEHALVGKVLPEERENADADAFIDETERVTEAVLLARENYVAGVATDANNYASGHSTTLSGTSQFSDYTNSNPIGVIKTGRNKIFSAVRKMPNVTIMGWEVAAILEDHDKIIERIKYSQIGVTTMDLVQQLFGLPGRVYIATAQKDTSNPAAATPTIAEVWGKHIVMAYVPERPSKRTPAYGYEFVWPRGGQVMTTERWNDVEHDVDKVRVRRRYDHKLIAVDSNGDSIAGYLIKNATA